MKGVVDVVMAVEDMVEKMTNDVIQILEKNDIWVISFLNVFPWKQRSFSICYMSFAEFDLLACFGTKIKSFFFRAHSQYFWLKTKRSYVQILLDSQGRTVPKLRPGQI